MAVADFDLWISAQAGVLGTAIVDCNTVPQIVAALTPEDFTGQYRKVFEAIVSLFRESKANSDIDPVTVLAKLGGGQDCRQFLVDLMGVCPAIQSIDRYIQTVRDSARLSRMRGIAQEIAVATSLEEASQLAEQMGTQLLSRPGLKSYGPEELLEEFDKSYAQAPETLPWPIPGMQDALDVSAGDLVLIGAEPSGGKTAFALQLMFLLSKNYRVLFVSLETGQKKLFARMVASIAQASLRRVKRREMTIDERMRYEESRDILLSRTFRILPAAGLSVAGIKAAAVNYRADVVIVDYLQIIQAPAKLSRYEQVTEISMALHIMAQTTGMVVIPLSQVTNRDPQLKSKPLDIHSGRESGQIEADCDVMLMIDKYVEQGLLDSGCKADRILRCVKNKEGPLFRIPLAFNGNTQTFSKAFVPNPDWEKLQNEKKGKKAAEPKPQEFEQFRILTDEDKNLPF